MQTQEEIIHTTIGVYPSGDFKTNGVKHSNLEAHIEYNKINRWGRGCLLMVNVYIKVI